MNEFAPNVWIADGPVVNFYGFPYPTRMVIIRLNTGCSWIWSPVQINDALVNEVEAKAGPVKYIISPNKIHHLFLKQWSDKPDAKVYAPPGLEERKVADGIRFDATFGPDEIDPPFHDEIDSVIVQGSYFMEEVEFFHKASKTAIICDLIQRHPDEEISGFKGMLMRLDGLVGDNGSCPREWRFSFWPFGKEKARSARDTMLSWKADKLIVAHGTCVEEGAAAVIERALSWI